MRFGKAAAALMSAAALVIAGAGCGSGDNGNNGKETGQNAPGGVEKVSQLTVWRLGDPTEALNAFHTDIEKQFQAKHPGVKINVQWVPWNDYTQKFQSAVAGGNGPDVTEVGNTDVLGWADQGAFADITTKVNAWADAKDIPAGMWSNDRLDGKSYAVPWYAGDRAVFYRKDLFAQLGLKVPTNWQELLDAAKKLQSKGVAGFEVPGGQDATFSIMPFIWGAGGEVATRNGGGWASQLASPQAKEGIAFYTDLVTRQKVSPLAAAARDSLGVQRDFAHGKVGMYIDGNWAKTQIVAINKKIEKNIGVFPLPGKNGGVAPAFAGGSDLAIWKDSKAPNLSWEYIQLLLTKENAQKYADIAQFFPTFTSLLNSPKYQDDAYLGPFAKALANAKSVPASKNWVEVDKNKTVLQTMVQNVMRGKKSVDQAASDAAKQMDELLNQ